MSSFLKSNTLTNFMLAYIGCIKLILKYYELSSANSLCRLEYDSLSSPMAIALFMAVVSLLSANNVATQFPFERYDCCLLKLGI